MRFTFESSKVASMAAFFIFAWGCSKPGDAISEGLETRAHAGLTEVFRPVRGPYLGADGGYTAHFDGRTYVFFSDTLVGRVEGDEIAAGARFVNNSLAELRDGQLVWHTPLEQKQPFVAPDEPGEWYWPAHPWVSPDGQTLNLFAYRMERRGVPGPFDFRLVGCDVLRWHHHLVGAPEVIPVDHCRPGEGALGDLSWGAWTLTDSQFVWIFGVRDNTPKELLVARAPVAGFSQSPATHWQFWNGDDFVDDVDSASPVLMRVSNEMGVLDLGESGYTAIFQLDGMSAQTVVSTAKSPVGPWSQPRVIWEMTGLRDKEFAYNARPHPALSKGGDVTVSININSSDYFGDFRHLHRLYFPRVIVWKAP